MPKQNSTHKNYDAGDLYDVQSLAENDMQWMSVAITDIKTRLKEIKKELNNENIIGFHALENVIDMYQYIADCRFDYHATQAEALKAEFDSIKGGEL